MQPIVKHNPVKISTINELPSNLWGYDATLPHNKQKSMPRRCINKATLKTSSKKSSKIAKNQPHFSIYSVISDISRRELNINYLPDAKIDDLEGDKSYLYIIYSDLTLHFVEIRDELEFATKHWNLTIDKPTDTEILMAGEIHRNLNTIYFNFESGTFMLFIQHGIDNVIKLAPELKDTWQTMTQSEQKRHKDSILHNYWIPTAINIFKYNTRDKHKYDYVYNTGKIFHANTKPLNIEFIQNLCRYRDVYADRMNLYENYDNCVNNKNITGNICD